MFFKLRGELLSRKPMKLVLMRSRVHGTQFCGFSRFTAEAHQLEMIMISILPLLVILDEDRKQFMIHIDY